RRTGLRFEAWVRFGQFIGLGLAVGLQRSDQENLVAPDDWRGAPGPRQFGLPFDVSCRVPLDGGIRAGRGDTVRGRSAPTWPIARGRLRIVSRKYYRHESKRERQSDYLPHRY